MAKATLTISSKNYSSWSLRGAAYGQRIMALPDMVEWVAAAKAEPAEIDELDIEF